MRKILQSASQELFLACAIFAVVLAVYTATLAPSIGIGDSGEFATAASVLGVAHPPGFPLYVLLGKLFTFLPFGSVAWRVNFMSAFFGALGVVFIALILFRLTRSHVIAAACALLLAFSEIYWSQSVEAEVYTLNAFFVALLVYLLLHFTRSRSLTTLSWFSFLYGLSIANHTMVALFAPVFLIYIFWIYPRLLRQPLRWLQQLVLFAGGLTPYLWLMIRSLQFPLLNWKPMLSFQDLLAHIGRLHYGDLAPQTALYQKLGLVVSFILELGNQFFYSTVLLAVIGFGYLFFKKKPLAFLTLGILLCNSVLIIYLRAFGWGPGIHYAYRFYYIPAYLVVIIWLGITLRYLLEVLHQLLSARPQLWRLVRLAFFATVLSLPINFLVFNYRVVDKSDFWFVDDYARALLESFAPNSAYYMAYDGTLQADTEIFSIMYLRMVEGVRPDIRVFNEQNTFYHESAFYYMPDYERLNFDGRREVFLDLLMSKDRPFSVYTNFPVHTKVAKNGYYSLSNGIVNQVYDSLENAQAAAPTGTPPALRNLEALHASGDFLINSLLAHYHFNLAAYYLTRGQRDKMIAEVVAGVQISNAPASPEYANFQQYRADWLGIDESPQNL